MPIESKKSLWAAPMLLLLATANLTLSTNALAGVDGSAFTGLLTLAGQSLCLILLVFILAIRGINSFFKAFAAFLFFICICVFLVSIFVYFLEVQKFGKPFEPILIFALSVACVLLMATYIVVPVENKWVRNASLTILSLAGLVVAIFFGLVMFH